MGKYCILCKKLAIKGAVSRRSLHRFPAPQYQKELWCQALNRDIKKLRPWTFICSDHFSSDSFVYRVNGQRFLKDHAVPLPFTEKVKRKKRTSKKIPSTINHVTIKKECEEQELLNTTLDREIKVEKYDNFQDSQEVGVKIEENCQKYEPSNLKNEDFFLKCELTEEVDIKNEEENDSDQSQLTAEDQDNIEDDKFRMGEEILEQPETESIVKGKNSGLGNTDNILRKMFKSMYPVHTYDGVQKCLECSFQTTFRPAIRRHFLMHRDSEYKKHPEKYKSYKTFRCSKCQYVSLQKYNLSRHLLKHKPKDEKEVKVFHCDCCEYSSKYRCDLLKHKIKHDPDARKVQKRFECIKCSYKTYDQIHLRRHTDAVHIENKRYKFECKKCEYKSDCMGHVNRHTKSIHGDDYRSLGLGDREQKKKGNHKIVY